MTRFRPRHDRDKPDPGKARAELDRIRQQRPDVEALVTALRKERDLNNFTANITVVFRGGRS